MLPLSSTSLGTPTPLWLSAGVLSLARSTTTPRLVESLDVEVSSLGWSLNVNKRLICGVRASELPISPRLSE